MSPSQLGFTELTTAAVLAAVVFKMLDLLSDVVLAKVGGGGVDGFSESDRGALRSVHQVVKSVDPATGAPAIRCRADQAAQLQMAQTHQRTVELLAHIERQVQHVKSDVNEIKRDRPRLGANS